MKLGPPEGFNYKGVIDWPGPRVSMEVIPYRRKLRGIRSKVNAVRQGQSPGSSKNLETAEQAQVGSNA